MRCHAQDTNRRHHRGLDGTTGRRRPEVAWGKLLRDLYQILGIRRAAPREEIQKAYRRRAKSSHPDAGGSVQSFGELAEAYAVKGLALYADGRYAEATHEFEQALALGPDLFETHFFYARNCRLQGLHEQAAALLKRAATLRLNDFRSLGLLSESYKALGRWEDLVVAARLCLERLEAEIEAHPDNAGALAFGSAVLAELGQGARAKDWAARSNLIAPDDYLAHYNVARTHAILGERDAALAWLERAFCSSATWQRRLALWMKSDGDIDPLRGHPRFRDLVQRLETVLEPPP